MKNGRVQCGRLIKESQMIKFYLSILNKCRNSKKIILNKKRVKETNFLKGMLFKWYLFKGL